MLDRPMNLLNRRQHRMKSLKRLGLAAVLLTAGCSTGVVKPLTPLRLAYQGAAGDVRSWRLEQVIRGEFVFNGMPQLLAITLKGSLTERIEDVTPEGRRRVTQSWSFEPVEFNGMPMPLEAIPRQVVSHALRGPEGDLESLEDQGAAGDVLAWAARWIGGFFPRLADHPVLAGEPWNRTEPVQAGGGSEFVQVTGGELTGMDGDVALLKTSGDIRLTRSAAGSGMETFAVAYAGRVRFVTPAGFVTESRQDGTLSFKGRTARSPLSIRARFTSSLVAVPSSPPVSATAIP